MFAALGERPHMSAAERDAHDECLRLIEELGRLLYGGPSGGSPRSNRWAVRSASSSAAAAASSSWYSARPADHGPPDRRVCAWAHAELTQNPRDVILRGGESIAQWGTRTGRWTRAAEGQDLSLARLIRGLASGDWAGADAERAALAENPAASGGVLVPDQLWGAVIDLARGMSGVARLGATIVPMSGPTTKVPRLLTAPVPVWRTEGQAISETGATWDTVSLTAKSLAVQVRISWELSDDTAVAEDTVRREFAKAFAWEWDRVGLRGTGTAPEPRGVRNTSGITTTAFGGANGAVFTNWDPVIDAAGVVSLAGWEPTGILLPVRTEIGMSKLKDTANQYMAAPAGLPPRIGTTQIPTDLVAGTSTDTTEVYAGAWSSLLLGVRTQLRIRTLEERYADYGQVGLIADFRGDVAVAQPSAFNVVTGVRS